MRYEYPDGVLARVKNSHEWLAAPGAKTRPLSVEKAKTGHLRATPWTFCGFADCSTLRLNIHSCFGNAPVLCLYLVFGFQVWLFCPLPLFSYAEATLRCVLALLFEPQASTDVCRFEVVIQV